MRLGQRGGVTTLPIKTGTTTHVSFWECVGWALSDGADVPNHL